MVAGKLPMAHLPFGSPGMTRDGQERLRPATGQLRVSRAAAHRPAAGGRRRDGGCRPSPLDARSAVRHTKGVPTPWKTACLPAELLR
jgi:hypothetical protein